MNKTTKNTPVSQYAAITVTVDTQVPVDTEILAGIETKAHEVFIPVEEIFPEWPGARDILRETIEKSKGYTVDKDPNDPNRVLVGTGFNMRNVQLLPREQAKVLEILHRIQQFYTPLHLLQTFHHKEVSQMTFHHIKSELRVHESRIVACGGNSLKEDLLFYFGLDYTKRGRR